VHHLNAVSSHKFVVCLQLWVPTDRVPDHHPGEQVFDSSCYLMLFSYPETLTLSSCGFVPGRSRTDNKLVSLSPGKNAAFCFDVKQCHFFFILIQWVLLIILHYF